MDKKYYSWQQFTLDGQKIKDQIKEDFDCLVGIAKGGIFLTGLMAQLMDTRNVYLVSYQGGGSGEAIFRLGNIHPDLKNKKILLLDDLSDQGDTLVKVKADLENMGNKVKIATLHYKPGTKLIPDYFASLETAWIVYPWEEMIK
ncbi:MAG: phosphoribosyltransferase family protein [Candidatus Buchananbacteria bacterium]|nr:phosphoribosyltransferase family protein [Candidatus Buchananbacteria bacterium]